VFKALSVPKFGVLLLLAIFLSQFHLISVFAQTPEGHNTTGVYFVSDFDSTIVAGEESRSKERNGSWNTPFVLRRVFYRGNVYQPVAEGDQELIVSQRDFYNLTIFNDYLARGETKPGIAVGRIMTVTDMKTGKKIKIRPSEYMAAPDWFRFYRGDPTGQRKYLVEDFHRAVEGGKWKGPLYPIVAAILSTSEGAKAMAYQSARFFPDPEWNQLHEEMAKETMNDALPIRNSPAYYASTSSPDFEKFSENPTYAPSAKPGWQEELIRMVIKQDIANAPTLLSPNGDAMKKTYFIPILEDNPDAVERIHELFKKYATDTYGRHIKFGLYNGGFEADVKRTGRPRFSIYMNNGLVRPATEAELFGEVVPVDPAIAAEAIKVLKGSFKNFSLFKPKFDVVYENLKVAEDTANRKGAASCGTKNALGGAQ
jgi:hypothetical protein